jgi:hypothetical protein
MAAPVRSWHAGGLPQLADGPTVGGDGLGGQLGPGRLVQEGRLQELVGEAGHGAADAPPAHRGTAADPVDPAALADVALHHGAPAAELDDALERAILGGEIGLLVVAGPVAALVQGLAEQPARPALLVQRDGRRLAGGLVEQVQQRLQHVVRLHRTARHVDNVVARTARGLPAPAQVILQAHAAGRIARHGRDAAVSAAGAGGDHGPRLRGQPVDPVAGQDRLAGRRVSAQAGPVALGLVPLVGDRPLDDEQEQLELPLRRAAQAGEELVAVLVGQDLIVQPEARHAGNRPEHQVFQARLRRGGHGDGVAVAAQTGRQPDDVDLLERPFPGSGERSHGAASRGAEEPYCGRGSAPPPQESQLFCPPSPQILMNRTRQTATGNSP